MTSQQFMDQPATDFEYLKSSEVIKDDFDNNGKINEDINMFSDDELNVASQHFIDELTSDRPAKIKSAIGAEKKTTSMKNSQHDRSINPQSTLSANTDGLSCAQSPPNDNPTQHFSGAVDALYEPHILSHNSQNGFEQSADYQSVFQEVNGILHFANELQARTKATTTKNATPEEVFTRFDSARYEPHRRHEKDNTRQSTGPVDALYDPHILMDNFQDVFEQSAGYQSVFREVNGVLHSCNESQTRAKAGKTKVNDTTSEEGFTEFDSARHERHERHRHYEKENLIDKSILAQNCLKQEARMKLEKDIEKLFNTKPAAVQTTTQFDTQPIKSTTKRSTKSAAKLKTDNNSRVMVQNRQTKNSPMSKKTTAARTKFETKEIPSQQLTQFLQFIPSNNKRKQKPLTVTSDTKSNSTLFSNTPSNLQNADGDDIEATKSTLNSLRRQVIASHSVFKSFSGKVAEYEKMIASLMKAVTDVNVKLGSVESQLRNAQTEGFKLRECGTIFSVQRSMLLDTIQKYQVRLETVGITAIDRPLMNNSQFVATTTTATAHVRSDSFNLAQLSLTRTTRQCSNCDGVAECSSRQELQLQSCEVRLVSVTSSRYVENDQISAISTNVTENVQSTNAGQFMQSIGQPSSSSSSHPVAGSSYIPNSSKQNLNDTLDREAFSQQHIYKLESQCGEFLNKIKDYESVVTALNQEMCMAANVFQNLDIELYQAHVQCYKLRQYEAELKRELSRLMIAVRTYQYSMAGIEVTNSVISADVSEPVQLEEMARQIKTLEFEKLELQNVLQEEKSKINQLTDEIGEFWKTNRRQRLDILNLNMTNAELGSATRKYKSQYKKLAVELRETKARLEDAKLDSDDRKSETLRRMEQLRQQHEKEEQWKKLEAKLNGRIKTLTEQVMLYDEAKKKLENENRLLNERVMMKSHQLRRTQSDIRHKLLSASANTVKNKTHNENCEATINKQRIKNKTHNENCEATINKQRNYFENKLEEQSRLYNMLLKQILDMKIGGNGKATEDGIKEIVEHFTFVMNQQNDAPDFLQMVFSDYDQQTSVGNDTEIDSSAHKHDETNTTTVYPND